MELISDAVITLLFSGEATNTEGEEGTVPGAIDTGVRAAR